jgi:hypothetical protein
MPRDDTTPRYPRSLGQQHTLRLLRHSADLLRETALVFWNRGDGALAAECEERAVVAEHRTALLREELETFPSC